MEENKQTIKGSDIKIGWKEFEDFLLIDNDGNEYYLKINELLLIIKNHPSFTVEKKRVRKWLHP